MYDLEFQDYVITKIVEQTDDGTEFEMDSGWSFYVRKYEQTPKVGDAVRMYGRGIGYSVRGLTINGVTVFYRTESEQKQQEADYIEKMNEEQRESYRKNKMDYDIRLLELPDVFIKRIEDFRTFRPEWGWKFEVYELMCCEDGVKIAETLKTREAIIEWYKLPYEEQKEAVPISDGHSGNSFGFATRLAIMYVEQPDLIPMEHGALCPLVGCENYGCYAVRNK